MRCLQQFSIYKKSFRSGAHHASWMLRRKLLIYSNEVVISLEVIKTDSRARGARCLLGEKEARNLHVKIASSERARRTYYIIVHSGLYTLGHHLIYPLS